MDTQAVRDYLLALQRRIIETLEAAELAVHGKRFVTDAWVRAPGERLQGRLSGPSPQGRRDRRSGC